MFRHRDAGLHRLGESWLVVTSDNAAAVGLAPGDQLPVDPYLVGFLTARVAVLEAVALGANPQLASSTLSFDYACAQGQRLTAGVLDLLQTVQLTAAELTGSCESNFPAEITCLGMTVVSVAAADRLLLGRVRPGDQVYLLGSPLVGSAVLPAWHRLPTPAQVQELAGWPEVHELIPVGSRGIAHELQALAAAYDLRLTPTPADGLDQQASAGPATCLLAVGSGELQQRLVGWGQPIHCLGRWQCNEGKD